MHQALYRKWRPKDFSDVVGEEHITRILQYEVAESKLSHAYLFCGSRGIGKTTCAKILAKAANCKNTLNGNPCNKCEICLSIDSGASLDVVEMDAASNTGVDYIRDIKDEIVFTPSELGKRVYIIDEVHMLSDNAFNALLKTLEEPPERVIFILATTEPHKIPATIVSRCQKFDFKRISSDVISKRLLYIAEHEKIDLTPDGAFTIARLSQGGLRDAISLLELCASNGETITSERVDSIAGVVGREHLINVVEAITERNPSVIFSEISYLYSSSIDLMAFVNDLYHFYRDMMVQRILNLSDYDSVPKSVLDVSEAEYADIAGMASKFKYSTLVYHSHVIEEACMSIVRGADKRTTVEMALIKLCYPLAGDSNEILAARIDEVEKRLSQLIMTGNSYQPTEKEEKEPVINEKEEPVIEQDAEMEPVNNWEDICEFFMSSKPSIASFLKMSKSFRQNDVLVIITESDFSEKMLSGPDNKNEIINVAKSLGLNVNSIKFIVEKKQSDSEQMDLFDNTY